MPAGFYYRPGDYYQIDDLSGFKIRASRSKKIPGGQTGGLIVAPERFETQQPQDFVRGVIDNQTVPQPRPRQPNRFTVTATIVTAFSPRMSPWITVEDPAGFNVLDNISIMLDEGENHFAIIIQITGYDIRFTPVLPFSVGGNIGAPIENTVFDWGPSNYPAFLTDDHGVPITDEDGNLFSISQ